MNNLPVRLQESLHRLGISQKDRLLIAVSGGLDSVVLTACCAMANFDFGIIHVNFQLRGKESERDEDFVRKLAMKYGKPFLTKKVDTTTYAENKKVSIQVAARNLRYEWFKTFIGNETGKYNFLLTAHHMDDDIETMLMNFFRGTGITGLTGIPEKNDKIIRPFLSLTKKQLKEFADEQKLDWVEDSSNGSDDYTRNYFRNQLIPSLSTIFPELNRNLEKNLERFSETELLFREAIEVYRKRLVKVVGSEIHIPILLLKKANPIKTILFEILKEYGFSPAQTDQIIDLMDSPNGKFISGISHRIIKNRRWLIIAEREAVNPGHLIIEQNQHQITFPEGEIHFVEVEANTGQPNFLPGTEYLDAGNIQFPLILRKWKAGDYFYPLGMKKKKKLARFLIDQKLSRTAKERVWVLLSDSQIICVIGHRMDERFRVKPSTKKVLQIKNVDVSARS